MYFNCILVIQNSINLKQDKMSKQKKEVKEKAIEVTLWDAANKLRGSVEPAEYKHVVLV